MFGKRAKVELLRRVPLFAECSNRELAYIALVSKGDELPAGHTLIEEGKLGREFSSSERAPSRSAAAGGSCRSVATRTRTVRWRF